MRGAFLRFRAMAYVVGTWLLLLVGVAMPLKYAGDEESVIHVVGPVHGFLFMAYLAATFDLARRVGWPARRTLLVMLAGTIPFLSFVAERRVAHDVSV